jgi:nitronate monooxygenase
MISVCGLASKELVPIMIGGMGVDISTAELALEAARLGGSGISPMRWSIPLPIGASIPSSSRTSSSSTNSTSPIPTSRWSSFDLEQLAEATRMHVGRTMEAKRGDGLIFVNCMEKLTMNAPRETLRVRMQGALDAGIDGITLAAGLHLGSFALIEDHPRFRDAKLGIIVSSCARCSLFLRKTARCTNRLPDYVVVEGPLAGGHLGFGMDWAQYDLATIVAEIHRYLQAEQLDIPLIPAGGIFTGSDAVSFLEQGAAAVQVATRFTVSRECGLPEDVKQVISKPAKSDIEVNQISPTGYPMRMLKQQPGIGDGIRPNCEAYGYLLDSSGNCSVHRTPTTAKWRCIPGRKGSRSWTRPVCARTCATSRCWTCGHYTYRLKDTTRRNEDGSYQLLSAEHIFRDYQFSTDRLAPE